MDLKKEIDALTKEKKLEQAHIKLNEFIKTNPTLDNYIYAEKIYKNLSKKLNFPTLKIAILRSITIEPILPFLNIKCYESKINPDIYLGEYNIIDQEILNKTSGLYKFQPDILIIFTRLEEICPILFDSYLISTGKEIKTESQGVIDRVNGLLSAFRSSSKAKIILHNFELPPYPVFGIIDQQHDKSQQRTFEHINNKLAETAKKYEEVYVLDYEQLTSRYGKKNWFNEKLWFTSKAPISLIGLEALANEYLRYFIPMLGLTKKCIVLDLDNTLWGGILGEEGLDGIKLGHTSPGNAFMDFQKELSNLYNKGFILAINSKNNRADVMEVFDKHPNMVLKKKHFASMKINWADKVQNMKELAKDLNIDMNTFVFFDDNPIERELIKQQLPQIHTVDLPKNPHLYSQILKELPDFEMLSLSKEDMKRGEMYYEQIQRKKLKESSTSLRDFYRSLEMTAVIKLDDKFSIPRLTKMTQKTNQFNLTTIRYSESDISNFINSKNYRVYSLQLLDKFGDNGIVGEIIIKDNSQEWEIDTFLLSCRVIGRTVETAFLAYIIEEAQKSNIKNIKGKYIPTKKNIPVEDLYKKHNFDLVEEKNRITLWKIGVEKNSIKCPDWIKIIEK